MADPDPEVVAWASASSSPWLLRAGDREVVLRVGRAELAAETATEVTAMNYAARMAGVTLPVAELLGYDLAVRTGSGSC